MVDQENLSEEKQSRAKRNRDLSVEAYDHDDVRPNIPTADAAEHFFDLEQSEVEPLLYPRNPSLDPQLVWKGKDEQDEQDLSVDAPPIYIQEKVIPRAIIDDLRKNSSSRQEKFEPTLWDDFDELDELSQLEFYQHEESWKNRFILGDSLQVMASLAERESLRAEVQTVYIDPPYGITFGSNWQARTSKRDVKDGNLEDAAREVEQIRAFRDTWELGIHSYLSYLRDRLVVSRDLLNESGSLFLQIGEENLHLVRNILDEVFGSQNYMSTIAFRTTSGLGASFLKRTNDFIIWYAKNRNSVKFRKIFVEKAYGDETMFGYVESADGNRRRMTPEEKAGSIPNGHKPFRYSDLVSSGLTPSCVFDVDFESRKFSPGRSRSWKTNFEGMEKLKLANRLAAPGRTLQYVTFHHDFPVSEITNVWTDTVGELSKTYVVQTARRVIERCVLMTTDPGDLVLDPTCGSGTTAFVAEQWGRRWITVDTSRVALALSRQRLMGAKFPYYTLADSKIGRQTQGLPNSETKSDIRKGFVYNRVPHVTLKSIATNPDLREGMTQPEIDQAITRHADFEYLYDKPQEDTSRVRVTGPFTVESLAPHRSLTLDEGTLAMRESSSDKPSGFESSILENLRRAGIQNGRRDERTEFANFEPYAGTHVQALATLKDSDVKYAISIGPQYGSVSARFIKNAAKEAVEAGTSTIAVMGFAFDPQLGIAIDDDGFASVAEDRNFGKIRVLIVRMNVDLLMGESLKKTGAGNLFTVFGEPDIELRQENDKWVVEVKGVDIYDPTSGIVRSNSTREIALWMVDTDYDGESFFVRQAYFLGENDPYKALKKALRTEIDLVSWESLNQSFSTAFTKPSTGKIAVKVINDYGDEVMKVIEVG